MLRKFDDYYGGYTDDKGKYHEGYVDFINRLNTEFPLSKEEITGEQKQKEFITLFGAILRMRNVLSSFDDFKDADMLSERDLQDYLGKYQDLRDEIIKRREQGDLADISDDIVFEVELIRQIEINIDYILLLVSKYHKSNGKDKEVLVSIRKAVDSSPELRSKKELIEGFIASVNSNDDVTEQWKEYIKEMKEKELASIINDERLNPERTRAFLENALQTGEIKTTGTDIDNLMPPVSRFGGGGDKRIEKKKSIIKRLQEFFEHFFGIG